MKPAGAVAATAAASLLAATTAVAAPDTWTVKSPNGALRFTLQLDARPAKGTLRYSIERIVAGVPSRALDPSPLGLRRADEAFEEGLRFLSAGPELTVDETYLPPHGKASSVRHQARQQTFAFGKGPGKRLDVVVRVANDGVAFRYVFPGNTEEVLTLVEESTGFQLPPGTQAWMMPQAPPARYTPAYEDYYVEVPAGTAAPTPSGWTFPALFEVEGGKHCS
jgi:hypothetical protein